MVKDSIMIDKKKIKRNRILSYFITAAIEIIDEEGLSALTIRKVADKAGYNSATLYHYFPSMNHLALFASIHYLKDYAFDLSRELPETRSSLEAYLKVWECFCENSYKHSAIYENLFFHAYENLDLNEIFQTYYEVFPNEITEDILEYSSMLMESNIFRRESIALKKALESAGFQLDEETVGNICEMNILIYRGMLSTIETGIPVSLSLKEAVSHTVSYLRMSLIAHGIPKELLPE